MRLSQLDEAQRLADIRSLLLKELERSTTQLTVAIDGIRQDDALIDAVRPVVTNVLRQRIQSIESDLYLMGVRVSV